MILTEIDFLTIKIGLSKTHHTSPTLSASGANGEKATSTIISMVIVKIKALDNLVIACIEAAAVKIIIIITTTDLSLLGDTI